MQPYLFPYIGYFQLVHACQRFVFLDDAAFIRQGWINRNRILLNGAPHTFTVPVSAQSSFVAINETIPAPSAIWRSKLITTIDQAYRKAPQHSSVMPLVESVLTSDASSVAELAENSVTAVMEYIGLKREMRSSSQLAIDAGLRAQERVIAICLELGTRVYINAPGGRHLYSKESFLSRGMELRFLQVECPEYNQRSPQFHAGLSIIDVLMSNDIPTVNEMLVAYALVE